MSRYLGDDYIRFKKEIIKSSATLFKIENNFEVLFKKHHKSTYCIALILTKLKNKFQEENKLIFLTEILSDFLTISKLSFLGFETPSLIILRRIIENFYNRIYYFDHYIEYEHLNLGRNEYFPIDKLKKYFETHPVFFESEDDVLKEYNDLLFNNYHQLCKVVHSKGKDSMNLASCLKDIRQSFDIDALFEQFTNIEQYIIYLIYKFHKELKFTQTEKNIIISVIPSNKRNLLNE